MKVKKKFITTIITFDLIIKAIIAGIIQAAISFFTKKKLEEIVGKDGIFKLNGNRYEVNFISKYKGKVNDINSKPELSDKTDEIKIVGCYSLYQQTRDVETKTGKQRFKLDKDISNLYSTIGGFKNISQANGINQTKMFK